MSHGHKRKAPSTSSVSLSSSSTRPKRTSISQAYERCRITLDSHHEDHIGYCSDPEIEQFDDEIEVVADLPSSYLTIRRDDVLAIMRPRLPDVLTSIIVEYALELTPAAKRKLQIYRQSCSSEAYDGGCGCCCIGESFTKIKDIRHVDNKCIATAIILSHYGREPDVLNYPCTVVSCKTKSSKVTGFFIDIPPDE
jgi:hypothetical protein